MLMQFLRPLVRAVLGPSLPVLTTVDVKRIETLRAEIRALPRLRSSGVSSEDAWIENANRLRHLIFETDPRGFLRWDVISRTMFVWHAKYLRAEMDYLKRLSDWKLRWKPAIQEVTIGLPDPYMWYPASSGNLIHHAFHLAQFESRTKCRVDEMELVFEFGGGYGSMCRLFKSLGFRGMYVTFDLPEFAALQRYYLTNVGVAVKADASTAYGSSSVLCLSDLSQLSEVLVSAGQVERSLFIATWSLSESPMAIRESILSLVRDFGAFLIAYQGKFREIDNERFFRDWQASMDEVAWRTSEIPHIPDSRYLVGVQRDRL